MPDAGHLQWPTTLYTAGGVSNASVADRLQQQTEHLLEYKMTPVMRIAFALCLLVIVEAHQETVNSVNEARRSRSMDVEANEVESSRSDEDSWWPAAEFAVIQKVYDDCSTQAEMTACLKSKALNALSRAVEQVQIITIKSN